jgi:lyso-ornithine lipid O-acyltransferase
MRYLRAITRLVVFFIFALVVIVIHACCAVFGKKWSFSCRLYTLMCWLFSINVRVEGVALHVPSVLYISNHLSYLDIVVLGSKLDGVFVAKSDLADWPLFGYLSKIQNTVFIKRTAVGLVKAQEVVAGLLRAGLRVIVFPEGTSTNGASVKPFKPGVFEVAYGADVKAHVQPVAIVLEKVNGLSVQGHEALRNAYSWWMPETTLLPHLWNFACLETVDVVLHFLPALSLEVYSDRKALAQAAYEAITEKINVPVAQPDRALVS